VAVEALIDLADGAEHIGRAADGSVVRAAIPWFKERPGGPVERLLFATLRLKPGRLTVEVNSRKRAAAVRRLIARRLGAAARLRQTMHEPVEAALRDVQRDPKREEKARAAEEKQALLFAEHPELGPALEQYTPDYYRRWIDMRLPALGGKTPRVAARTEKGRKAVRALVDDIERLGAVHPGGKRVDVGWMRRELGLEE
jgi:hypothetical protein